MAALEHDHLCQQSEHPQGCPCSDWISHRGDGAPFNPALDCDLCQCECEIIKMVRDEYPGVEPVPSPQPDPE